MNNSVWEKRRKRLFELIEIGSNYDAWCWGYDFFNTFTILLNLAVSIMYTFDNMELKYGPLLLTLERLTVAFFAIDFLLRVFTAKYLYPDVSEPRAIWKYLTSFSGTSDKQKTLKQVMTHPCILACVLGIILMVTGLPLPLGLDGAVTAVGNCNTAMSMMVIGMILADIDLKDFWDWTVVKYTVHRLVVIPAVVYIVCRFLPLNKTVLGLCVLLAAMPAGATTSILAEKYQVDSPFATKMVIFSTLLSLPTICLWSIFLQ